jgi:Spy/CpxP family protein refolding chaperone
MVIQFQHISAESFVETLEQLARHDRVDQALRGLPHAINEQANAVVVIAPPDIAQMLEAIAKGLDRPCRYHQKVRRREREEAAFEARLEQMRRGGRPAAGRPPCGSAGRWHRRGEPTAARGRGSRQPPQHPAPMRRPLRAGPDAPAPPGEPGRGLRHLWALTGPGARQLGLTDEQVGEIRDILRDHGVGMVRLFRRGRRALADAPAEQRAERMRRLGRSIADQRRRRLAELHERIRRVLTEEQREAFGAWRRVHRRGRWDEGERRRERPDEREGPGGRRRDRERDED